MKALKHLSSGAGVLVSARYSPGFAIDLTHWVTQIHENGKLFQEIHWHRPGQDSKIERHKTDLSTERTWIAELRSLLAGLDLDAVSELCKRVTVDDAGSHSLTIPSRGFSAEIPLEFLEHESARALPHLPRKEHEILESWRELWTLIHRHALEPRDRP